MNEKKTLPDKCAVARDLMPLCVDGTASEASRRRVDKHVIDCPPCATVYQEMQTAIDLDVPDRQEAEQFDSAVKKVKHKHAWRKVRNVLLGVVLALVLCLGAAVGYYWYFVEEVPVPVELYEIRLTLREPQSDYTPVIIHAKNMPKAARLNVEVFPEGKTADNKTNWVMYIWAGTTRATNLDQGGYADYSYYAFDQRLYGENNYHEGDFVINGTLLEVNSVYQGAADAEQTLLFKRDMAGCELEWKPAGNEVLRSPAFVNAPKHYVPFVTVPPILTMVPQSTLTPMPIAN